MNIRSYLVLCTLFVIAFFFGLVVYMKWRVTLKTCEKPKVKNMTFTCPFNHHSECNLELYPGDVMKAACIGGYRPNEQFRNLEITCMGDGKWSLLSFECVPVTCDIPNISKMTLKCPNNNESKCESEFFPGDVVSPECNAAYVPDVTPLYRDMKCLENGTWDQRIFQCVPVACESPNVPNMNFTCTKNQDSICQSKFNPGDVIKLACNKGYRPNVELKDLEITCLEDGYWSQLPFECVPVMCEISNLNNTNITCPNNDYPECESKFFPGDVVTPQCINGFLPDMRPPYEVMTCRDDGTWDLPIPQCVPDRRCYHRGIIYEYADVVDYANDSYICICMDAEIHCY